jgi:2-methylcitrate dehydratase
MNGFIGPKDIFRNPEAIFRNFEPTGDKYESPFNLVMTEKGNKFAVMDMHFKLGLYEHQSAGAIDGVLNLIKSEPSIIQNGNLDNINTIKVSAYEPAYGIIGDPAKRDPTTRQSADHSMVFILSRLI